MPKTDPRVNAYIAKAQPFAKPILIRFRKAVHAGCPDVTETMKWSFPHFDYKGVLCSTAAFKAHCACGLRGVQPVAPARIRRVDHRGKVRRDQGSPPRDSGAVDGGRQEPELEVPPLNAEG